MTSLNLGQQTTELGIELGTVWCQTPVHSQFLIFITLLLKDWFWEFLSTNAIAIWNHRKPWLSVLETYHMHVGWSVFLFFSVYFLIFFSALKKICFFLWLIFCYVWMKRTYRQKKKKINMWSSASGSRSSLYLYRSSSNFVTWKYPKWKMHLIHLTYWTSEFSLVYMKCAQNTC